MRNDIINFLVEDSLYSILDSNFNIVKSSFKYLKKIGCKEEESIHKDEFIFLRNNQNEVFEEIRNAMYNNKTWNGILEKDTSNERVKYFESNIRPLYDKNALKQILVYRKDITQSVYDKNHCALTNLRNKHNLVKYLNENLEEKSLMFLINIDNFRVINDVYGGKCGDLILMEFANLLSKYDDYDAFRLKGDEFVMRKTCCHIKKSKNIINKFKKSIERKLNKPIEVCSVELKSQISVMIRVTISVSISKNNNILQEVDIAHKEARLKNKHFMKFNSSMIDLVKKQKHLEVVKDIQTGNVIISYQPIVCNKSLNIYKYEALARIKNSNGKILMPYEFFDLSQQVKLYHSITRAVLANIYKDILEHDIYVSCNITMADIESIKTYNFIMNLLRDKKFSKNITFEIVETVDISSYERFNKFSRTVRERGAKIAIDDFGVGYSNFSHLSNIEFDYLKIDGQFIKNILISKKDEDIVKLIADFAQKHNIKTIAEFVEDDSILQKIIENKVDYSQGYYFGKPMPIEEIIKNRTCQN